MAYLVIDVGPRPAVSRPQWVRRPVSAPRPRRRPIARSRSRARLTRRGRAVLLLVAVAAFFGVLSLGRVATQAATHVSPPPRLAHVVVRPGETLWAVATRADPGADPRVVVAELMALNHLGSAHVVPGQALLLPRS